MSNLREDNTMIDRFMSYNAPNIEGALPYGDYTNSWVWLMPVIEQIEGFGYEFSIYGSCVNIRHNSDHSTDSIISHCYVRGKLESAYQGVIEFIKMYNEGKIN